MTQYNIDTIDTKADSLPEWSQIAALGFKKAKADFVQLAMMVKTWNRRHKNRHELLDLSDETLNDIGLSRAEIEKEYKKPFWIA